MLGKIDCMTKLYVESMHVIKRQQKELADMQRYVEDIRVEYDTNDTARAETIKEFAERIEPKMANNTDISAIGYQSVIAIIDNLVKEMTEDTK
jgi:nitric oxide synthase oxygenase domain/subunit